MHDHSVIKSITRFLITCLVRCSYARIRSALDCPIAFLLSFGRAAASACWLAASSSAWPSCSSGCSGILLGTWARGSFCSLLWLQSCLLLSCRLCKEGWAPPSPPHFSSCSSWKSSAGSRSANPTLLYYTSHSWGMANKYSWWASWKIKLTSSPNWARLSRVWIQLPLITVLSYKLSH